LSTTLARQKFRQCRHIRKAYMALPKKRPESMAN
jgi:hypothetical protein